MLGIWYIKMAGMLDFCVRDHTYEYGLQNYVKIHSVCSDA